MFAESALVCRSASSSVLQLSPRENEVFYDVVAIVDPLTREAQKMSPLLIVSCILLSYSSAFFSRGTLKSFSPKGRVQKHKACHGAGWVLAFSILTWRCDKVSWLCPFVLIVYAKRYCSWSEHLKKNHIMFELKKRRSVLMYSRFFRNSSLSVLSFTESH